MEEDLDRVALKSRYWSRQMWRDVDLNEMLDACERYLEAVPLTADRSVLMALVLRVRQLGARLEEL